MHRLDYDEPDWRVQSAGTPTHFYESGGNIGLYRRPDTAPSGGYPKVTLYTFERNALTAGGNMPGQVSNVDAWLYRTLHRYAMGRDPEKARMYLGEYRLALKDLADDIKARNARDAAQVKPYVPSVGNV